MNGSAKPVATILRGASALVALFAALAAPTPHVIAAAFGEPLWTNRYDGGFYNFYDYATAVAVDSSGNVFVTGYSVGSTGNYDYVTIKYSGEGPTLWSRRYNGPANGDDFARALAVDGSGNVFVTGDSVGSGGNHDYVTIKYSGTGALKWTNVYNGPGNGADHANALAVDGSGNVFVTGDSFNGTNTDFATVAYSNDGTPLWTNFYNGPGNGGDVAVSVAVDTNGNVFVAGASWNGTNDDFATVAYSGAGELLWVNRYNGPGNGGDSATAVAASPDGILVVTGTSWGGNNDDFATVAYTTAGVPLWTNRFNGPGNSCDSAAALAVDTSGNIFVAGSSFGAGSGFDYATIKYSGAGAGLWTNRFTGEVNGDDIPAALTVDGSGNVFVTGRSAGAASGFDYATVAYSGVGLPWWTNHFNGPENYDDSATAIAVNVSGDVFVTGQSLNSFFNRGSDYATIKYAGFSPASFTIGEVGVQGGEFQFVFNAEANRTYAVEFLDSLSASNWVSLANFPAVPTATNIIVTDAITNDARFYRVRTR